jgi:tripartite-type tricarboxylate transporter receptor subunit TctC
MFFCIPGISSAEDFYKDKNLRLVVGFSPGGGFDTYSRVIARHMSAHIPGNPTIIVENMPGAGSLTAANHLYRVAKPDGLTIGNFIGVVLMGQVLGRPGTEFEGSKFEYIGAPVTDSSVCAFTKKSGITSFEKWMSAKTPVKLGGTAPGSTTDDYPNILRAALSLPIQIVSGYKGTAEIRLAAESGEVDGGCWGWSSIRSTWRTGIESGDVAVVLQLVPKPHPELPKVPLAIDFVRREEERQLIQAGIHDLAAATWLYMLPPGTPKERVHVLRKAFQETMKDPQFLGDATKSKLDIDFVSGDELEKIVNRLYKLNPSILAKLRSALLVK